MSQIKTQERLAEEIDKWEAMPMTQLIKSYLQKEIDVLEDSLRSPTLIMHPHVGQNAARLLGQVEGLRHLLLVDLKEKLTVREEEEDKVDEL